MSNPNEQPGTTAGASVNRVVHTPGPWKVSRRFEIYAVSGAFVATTRGNWPLPEHINQICEADAKLMAAAPEMLDALQKIAALDYTKAATNGAAYEAVQIASKAVGQVV